MPLPLSPSVEFRTPIELIKLVNPTQRIILFNIATFTQNAFRVTPGGGRMDPSKEFEFRVELISTAEPRQIQETIHDTRQFYFEWIELPTRTPMSDWLDHNPQEVRDGTAIQSLRNLFATEAVDAKWAVPQQETINARFSAAMAWNRRARTPPSTLTQTPRPTTSISATAPSLKANIIGDILSYRHPLRPGASALLQLANTSPQHIVIFKWLIAASKPLFGDGTGYRYYVRPHSGRIDPEMETGIKFVIDTGRRQRVGSEGEHSEKFKLRWIEAERGTEIGDWVERELTVNESDRTRWVEMTCARWGNRVKVHEWKMRTLFEEGDDEGEMEVDEAEEAAVKQEKGSPGRSANRLSLRCVLGQSIGLYQWNVKIE
ncbi:hypothetical protein BC938DRAFT_482641 [Jimgerdemannia flammicorona]|uniref:MSP domain-containing protein n=1 Tax=Jimgerdemannia flammicorona TaxID=994334 RepID=A0A433QDI0_9FUNG|nr:hypothetical protein BC938DRAFT_482641 [Jimgerdemannia flammicorona]